VESSWVTLVALLVDDVAIHDEAMSSALMLAGVAAGARYEPTSDRP